MDEAQRVQKCERAQRLACNPLDARIGEVKLVTRLLVILLEFVQVRPQQLAYKEQVLLLHANIQSVHDNGYCQLRAKLMKLHYCNVSATTKSPTRRGGSHKGLPLDDNRPSTDEQAPTCHPMPLHYQCRSTYQLS